MSAWNARELSKMALPPCHYAFQMVCRPSNALLEDHSDGDIIVDCVLNMRSTDIGLGLPFNIASYALLTVLVCVEAATLGTHSFQPGELVVNMADSHIYEPHLEALQALERPSSESPAPTLVLPQMLSTTELFASSDSEMMKGLLRNGSGPVVKLELFT